MKTNNKEVSLDDIFESFAKWLTGMVTNLTGRYRRKQPTKPPVLSSPASLYEVDYSVHTQITASLFSVDRVTNRKPSLEHSLINPNWYSVNTNQIPSADNDNVVKDYIDDKGKITRLTVRQLKEIGVIK